MASSHQLPPGTIIADKYELEGLLGEGGMGAVYQATNLAIGRRVAIKVLNAGVADQDGVRHRFELEARAAAVISHPGIVDVLDMGQTEDGEPFIVMEHLEGMTLRSLVKERKRLAVGEAVGVMAAVLEALSAAHRAGVIHRDVKPANIFVCVRPRVVKLLDFGVSRFGESSGLTRTGTAIGTPRYMAPEQVLGQADIGPEADLYSVGAVLYSLLGGRPPHGTGNDTAVLARILHDTPEPLATLAPDAPAEVCALVDSLLSKDRAVRPKKALEVRDALLRAVPQHDLAALYEAAEQSARAAALAPTPSSSQANLAPVRKRTVSSPSQRKAAGPRPSQPSNPDAPTRADVQPKLDATVDLAPAPRGLPLGLLGGLAVVMLVVGLGVAWWVTRPPVAPVVEAPAPPPAVPAAPAPVVVTLEAEPASARVLVGGVDLGCNPCKLSGEVGTTREVRVTAAGMAETALTVKFDKERTERVVLAALPAVATPEPGPAPGPAPGPKTPPKKGKGKGKGGGLAVDEKNPYE